MVSRRVAYLLLLAIILLSIIVRYPLVEHERFQTDSYTLHYMAQSVVDSGHAKWIFNPFSYFGLYELNYPSGVPFILAGLSELTGLSMEVTVLVASMMFGIMSCLAVFVLARHFIRRPEYVLLATFFAILGARFIDTTYWDGSARGPMIVLVTFAAFTAFRASATGQPKLLMFGFMFGVGCFATHHMSVLLVLFGFGYLLAAFEAQYLMKKIRVRRISALVICNVLAATVTVVIAFTFFDYFRDLALLNLRSRALFDVESETMLIVLNMAVSYVNQIGFILVFAVLGLPSLLRHSHFSVEKLFPITLAIAFIPMLGNTLYVSMLLSPFVAVLGTLWISRLWDRLKRKRLVFVVVVLLMASSIIVPVWSSDRWNAEQYPSKDTVEADSRVYSDATYLMHQIGAEYGISNVNTYYIQIDVFSGTRFLASGIALAVTGDVTADDMERNVSWSSKEFPLNLYQWFEFTSPAPWADQYVRILMTNVTGIMGTYSGAIEARAYFDSHSRLLVAVDKRWPDHWVGQYNIVPTELQDQLLDAQYILETTPSPTMRTLQSYLMYESGRTMYYLFELPS